MLESDLLLVLRDVSADRGSQHVVWQADAESHRIYTLVIPIVTFSLPAHVYRLKSSGVHAKAEESLKAMTLYSKR